jgi:hypothetical protein
VPAMLLLLILGKRKITGLGLSPTAYHPKFREFRLNRSTVEKEDVRIDTHTDSIVITRVRMFMT